MHTTALCSPTRSCILTGRNHHSNGVACIMELATGYPGYDGRMPFENGMLPEMLLEHGYNTFCLGKWHLSPSEDNTPAGPFHRWPLGRGFERFYGFLGGETNQWYPDLTQDNALGPAAAHPEEGYHLSEDLADQAIKLILDAHVNAPEKPFFMYYAPGAAHAPHHVPKEWADRYKGKFDEGWDAYRETVFARQQELGLLPADAELSPHDPDVPEWDTLSDDERRLYARMMEVFAGFVSHADHHFGRILDTLERIGELDNTLIMVISDNGASAEGGADRLVQRDAVLQQRARELRGEPREDRRARRPEVLQPLPVGLDVGRQHPVPALEARDLPRRRDRPVHPLLAGRDGRPRRDPHAVRPRDRHGPDRARRARRRSAPGDPRRRRSRRSRASASPTRSTTPTRRASTRRSTSRCSATARSTTTAGGRCARGRRPTSPRPRSSAASSATRSPRRSSTSSTARAGSCTTSPTDPTESHDVAAEHPERLRELIDAVVGGGGEVQGAAARRLDAGAAGRRAPADLASRAPASSTTRAASVVPAFAAPPVFNRPYSIEADVEIAEAAQRRARRPGRRRRRLHLPHGRRPSCASSTTTSAATSSSWRPPSAARRAGTRCASSSSRPASRTSASARASPGAASSTSTASSSPTPSSRTRRRCSSSSRGSAAATTSAPPAADGYEPPFAFTGTIHSVTFDLSGELIADDEAELARLMAQQ